MNMLKKFFENNNPKTIQLQKTVENVQSVIDKTDEENETARNKAIEVALTQLQENSNMPVGEFLKMLQEKTSLTEDNLVTIITQLPEIRSEKATIAAVRFTSLPDDKITSIVREADISLDTAEKIVNEIDDEKIQKEQQALIAAEREQKLLDKLTQIYENCNSVEDPLLVDCIEKLDIQEHTPEIDKKLMNIISKRTAIDCMKFGGPRLPTLARIVSAEDMFEADLPFLAFSKYKTLKSKFDDEDIKYTEFTDLTKNLIHERILEEIAKKTAENFDSSGSFIFPQTEKFKKLTDADISLFVKTVETYSKDFDKDSSERLTRQLTGKTNANTELNDTLKNIELAIRQMPPKSQLPAAKLILETLNQRNEANLLIKNIKHSSHDDER